MRFSRCTRARSSAWAPPHVGWLFAMQTVTTLATRPLIGVVSDRIGRRSVIVTGLVACSAAVWMISAAETVGPLVAAVLAYAARCRCHNGRDERVRDRCCTARAVRGGTWRVWNDLRRRRRRRPDSRRAARRRLGLCADVPGHGDDGDRSRRRLLCVLASRRRDDTA